MSKIGLEEILNYLRPFTPRAIVIQDNKAFEHAKNRIPTGEEFKRIVIEELKKRPVSGRATSHVTLDERLESLHLLDAVLSESVLDNIHIILQIFEAEERLRSWNGEHMSSLNVPAGFHVSVLRELLRHIQMLEQILQRDDVHDERLGHHIYDCRQEMMRQVRAICIAPR